MARRTLKFGILNIKTHPHSEEKYQQLFTKAADLQRVAKIRGLDCGVIGFVRKSDGDSYLIGTALRFVNIDPDKMWYDIVQKKMIDPKKGKINVPQELKPHLRVNYFVFFPKTHRLIIDISRFSPGSAEKLFDTILNSFELQKEFGDVTVLVDQAIESITRIMKLQMKSKIFIRITRPNGDDLTEARAKMISRLEDQNVKIYDETLSGGRGGNIKPDEDTKTMMKIARTDGYVVAIGRNANDEHEEISTKKHPSVYTMHYNSDEEDYGEALENLANKVNDLCQRQIEDNL